MLRSVVRKHPHLRSCLKRCRHCNILFLTHPRNALRSDIDCPFGCREALRKRRSKERSTAYYQTSDGKTKKQMLNARRKGERMPTPPKVDRPLIVHLQVVTSLIEGRAVSLAEIASMVKEILRQPSIGKWGKCVYEVPYADKSPP